MPLQIFDQVAVACDVRTVDEANAIRAMLESYRLRVHFFRFVQRRNAVDFFARGVPGCAWTVLVCHGQEMKIRFEVVDQVDGDLQAPDGWEDKPFDLTPDTIPELVTGAHGSLISLACDSGRTPFADAFLSAGYDAYIGPESTIHDVDASTLFAVAFFYHALAGERDYVTRTYTDEESVEQAAATDKDFEFGPQVFRYFKKDPRS